MTWREGVWLVIVLATLAGVAVGRAPVFRMNRATICLVGAVALILSGAITLPEAYRAIDLDTLTLLFAMMVLNANLRLAGFFRLAAAWTIEHGRTPRRLLALLTVSAGVLSALFLNDTIVLAFTPLVLEIAAAAALNPVPYLVALAMAANIGSTATLIGNPQNMLIGIASGIPFTRFALYLLPVAVAGLAVAWAVAGMVYGKGLGEGGVTAPALRVRLFRPLLRKGLVATALMMAALLAGAPPPLAALTAAALLLVTRRLKPERVFQEIDWTILVFFAALFVVTRAIETSGLGSQLLAVLNPLAGQGVAALTVAGAVLSNLVSNVPAVLLLKPVALQAANPGQAWLTLAMATTLAGNLTLLGSVANLIVAETARRHGVTMGFWVYLQAGLPVTLVTLALGAWWLDRVM